MFIRKDIIKKQLEPPLWWFFSSDWHKNKYFTTKDVTVSIDRLKHTCFLQIPDVTTDQSIKSKGQPVKPPINTFNLNPKVKKLLEKQSLKGRIIKLTERFWDKHLCISIIFLWMECFEKLYDVIILGYREGNTVVVWINAEL